MGTKRYGQLSLNERVEIYRLHAGGKSLRKVAKIIGRSVSTVSRELQRNSRSTRAWSDGYDPVRAQGLAERRRRWDGRYKLMRQPSLRLLVRERLAMGWSPEQIAGRLRQEQGRTVISHESIYRYIYHCSAQKDYWHRLLPRRKSRRGRLGKRGGSPVEHIKYRKTLHERPAAVKDRKEAGHWEADLMLFTKYGQAVLTLHERSSRRLLARRQKNKEARGVIEAIGRMFEKQQPSLRRTVTFDNGTEFALHYLLGDRLGIDTYFCDPHKPWQKGGIENAIGRLRRALPRKTDIAALSAQKLRRLLEAYNSTPRKCLGFRTPNEVFSAQRVALQT